MKNVKCYLLIHSISSVYMSTPISQFILLPIFPCGVHMFVLYICVPISALWEIGIVDLIFLPSLFEEKLLIIKECITLYSSYISGASQVVLVVKNPPPCYRRKCKRHGFNPWVRKISSSRKWHHTPVFLPGKSHGQRSLAGYSPQGHKESDMTEQLSTHTLHVSPCSIVLLAILL